MRITTLETILLNGGGNYQHGKSDYSSKLIEYNNGYMVSIKDIVKINLEAVSTLNVLKVVHNIIDTFNIEDTDAVYGFWIDSGSMYIDMSLNVFNLEDAMQVAKSTNQIAIWDCNLNESIIL